MFSRRSLMWVVVILLGLMAGACGPTAYEIQQQNVSAFNQEIRWLDAERHREWDAPYPAAAETDRERNFQSRARAAYQRYGLSPDAFQEALWAYRLAVMERIGSGEITKTQARALIADYGARLVAVRQQLQLLQWQAESADQAARAAFWSQFSQSMYQMGQAMRQYELEQRLKRPISCTTEYRGRIAETTCY